MRIKKGSVVLVLSIWVLVVALVLTVIVYAKHRRAHYRDRLDASSSAREAITLLAKVGGADKVCKEADQLFRRFPITGVDEYLFETSDLKNFPTIAALGQVDGIWSNPSRRIKVWVAGREGYFIEILETNMPERYDKSPYEVEIVKSRIYVHR